MWLWVHARSGITVSAQCTEAPLPSSQDLGEACMMGTQLRNCGVEAGGCRGE